ncbi:MAG: hypothetical protein WC297_03160 [Candidatus Paceibacterota bacterium]|jgi:hypothetical protein
MKVSRKVVNEIRNAIYKKFKLTPEDIVLAKRFERKVREIDFDRKEGVGDALSSAIKEISGLPRKKAQRISGANSEINLLELSPAQYIRFHTPPRFANLKGVLEKMATDKKLSKGVREKAAKTLGRINKIPGGDQMMVEPPFNYA